MERPLLDNLVTSGVKAGRQVVSRCFRSYCQRLQPLVAPVTHRNTLFSFVQSVQLLGVLGGIFVLQKIIR